MSISWRVYQSHGSVAGFFRRWTVHASAGPRSSEKTSQSYVWQLSRRRFERSANDGFLDVGGNPKIVGEIPPNQPFKNRVFHDFHHPFWGKHHFRKHLCGFPSGKR